MKKQKTLYYLAIGVASLLACVTVVKAASEYDITSRLGGVAGDYFNLQGIMKLDAIKIGRQGTGGVTFFNGTIVNETTNNGADNPVTFGDNVRIDGRVYRGSTAGTGDTLPFIVNDNMEVLGTLTTAGLSGSGIVTSDNITDGTIATADLADSSITTAKIADATIASGDLADGSVTSEKISDGTIAAEDLAASSVTNAKIADGAVTQAVEDTYDSGTTSATTTASGGDYDTLDEITMTTGDSTLFVMFSGYGTIDATYKSIRLGISIDGDVIDRTVRRETNGEGEGQINLVTSALIDVTAGEHTIRLLWQTDNGQEATMYAQTLDVIELKK